ncbi:hypothetical protein SDC9_136711 [bioreactor metagenome]|uniref:Uncharacterized protein n=1 Tax=bioreactor metagenome TaxID=1076179 RepID=A0A645DJW6_9ZZZZ
MGFAVRDVEYIFNISACKGAVVFPRRLFALYGTDCKLSADAVTEGDGIIQ